MPIRPARFSDIPVMARVLAASWGPDELIQLVFPHQDEYPEDLCTAMRRGLRASWWDYSMVIMVSYEEKSSSDVDGLDEVDKPLLVRRGGQHEIITGVGEWKRVGAGWESVWNLWGWWDPRRLIKKFFEWRKKVSYWFRPCRASARPTATDPDPVLWDNFFIRTLAYRTPLYSNPLTPWRVNHWCLEALGIHPRYQSKGYGKALVQYGLAKAACDTASGRTGIPCVVTSSIPGEPFYQRIGFKEVVGYSSRSVDSVEGINPLGARGIRGGAVIWTWVKEDEDVAKKLATEKVVDLLTSDVT